MLKNSIKEIYTPKVIAKTNGNKIKITFRDISRPKELIAKLKHFHTARKIESGKLPHGRTSSPRTPFMGGSVIEAHTLLQIRHIREGKVIDYREVIDRVVTNAGRDAIVDAFTGAFTLSNFNYHDCGTGTTTEATGDTAMETPVTEDRETGSQSQPTSDVYQSVATVTFANTYAITEHGLLSQLAKPGGTLLDRTVFAAVNVVASDSIQFTFTLTIASGG